MTDVGAAMAQALSRLQAEADAHQNTRMALGLATERIERLTRALQAANCLAATWESVLRDLVHSVANRAATQVIQDSLHEPVKVVNAPTVKVPAEETTSKPPRSDGELVEMLAHYMRQKLNENAHKPSWEDESTGHLLALLEVEVLELREAAAAAEGAHDASTAAERLAREAADVAAFAAMVAWNFGARAPL